MKIAILADVRFPGGTSSAIGAELDAICGDVAVAIYDVGGRMFRGREPNPKVTEAATRNGLRMQKGQGVISADIVVLHNPVLLKFESILPFRINCKKLIVVTHENFLSPQGDEEFDIAHCLDLLQRASVCEELWLAPISPWNRAGVEAWVAEVKSDWNVAPFDWFNICSFDLLEPAAPLGDRRGRLSRPGASKFPDIATMRRHFPDSAETHILGADMLLADPEKSATWNLYPFGSVTVTDFFDRIDFFVYFTNPAWRESFGRVIAEAIAAGKPVITDPGTAAIFGDAVIASDGTDLDDIIARYLSDTEAYLEFVRKAQKALHRFSPHAFRENVLKQLPHLRGRACF